MKDKWRIWMWEQGKWKAGSATEDKKLAGLVVRNCRRVGQKAYLMKDNKKMLPPLRLIEDEPDKP